MLVEFLFSAVDLENRRNDGSKSLAVALNGFGFEVRFGFYLFDKLPNSDVALFLNQLRPVPLNRRIPTLSLKRQKDVSGLGGSGIPVRGSQAPFVPAPAVLDVNRQVRGFVPVTATRVDGSKNPVSPVAQIGFGKSGARLRLHTACTFFEFRTIPQLFRKPGHKLPYFLSQS